MTQRHYDALGRVLRTEVQYGQQVSVQFSQSYNADGQKLTQSYPDGRTVAFHYQNGLLSAVEQPNGERFQWSEYEWVLPRTVQLPGATRHLTYDGFYRPSTIEVRNQADQALLSLSYQYDAESNITRKTEQLADLNGATTYHYDPLNRLTHAAPNPALQSLGVPTEQYRYDPVHNRISSAHQPGEWQYGVGNQLLQWGAEPEPTHYRYDANGQLSREQQGARQRTYTYNSAQRLTQIRDNDQLIADYQYDPPQRRIRKRVGSTTTYYLYSDEGLLAELNTEGEITRSYGWIPNSAWGTSPLWQAEHSPTQIRYHTLHSDHLGTPQLATDANGQPTWQAVMESFGVSYPLLGNTIEVNLRFPGQYYDAESGTYYNFHRDYHAGIGRYIQSDPIGLAGGMNVYLYANVNPLNFIDLLGLDSCSEWMIKGYAESIIRREKKIGNWSNWEVENATHEALRGDGAMLTCYLKRYRTTYYYVYEDKVFVFVRTCTNCNGRRRVEHKTSIETDNEGALEYSNIEYEDGVMSKKTALYERSKDNVFRATRLCSRLFNGA